jgi:outer membrane lipoprotein-sorting protein
MLHRGRRHLAPLVAALVVSIGVPAYAALREAVPSRNAPPGLEEVLVRFDRVQAEIRTLAADFTWTVRSPLLKEPQINRGRLYLRKPDCVLWEVSAPEVMRFVLAQDQYLGYFPTQKRAERKDIRRWSEQFFRYFGLGLGSRELAEFYDLRLEDPGAEMAGTHLLVLEPRRRRVKKRVEEVRLWVDEVSLLPVKIEYHGKDGNSNVIRFRDVHVNPELAENLFTLEVPSDVVVTSGFSLGGDSPGRRGGTATPAR